MGLLQNSALETRFFLQYRSWRRRNTQSIEELISSFGLHSVELYKSIRDLCYTVYKNNQKENVDYFLITKAYIHAAFYHRNQYRKSGDPYISHPEYIAKNISQYTSDSQTIAACLLHDTIEDTDCTYEELKDRFGKTIADLVNGVTKIDSFDNYSFFTHPETIKKMIVAISNDHRILHIKIFDRLHNMRTIEWLPEEKQVKKAKETLFIYTPLAERMGLNAIKNELEEISFKIINPTYFKLIKDYVDKIKNKFDGAIKKFEKELNRELIDRKISPEITCRYKGIYSIYQKLSKNKIESIDSIPDLIGFRIILNTVDDCYSTLGVIHSTWKPLLQHFKDYIAIPKSNGYRSLHTVLTINQDKFIEVQIRTKTMHKEAEYGAASHWLYKEQQRMSRERKRIFNYLTELLAINEEQNNEVFIDKLHAYLSSKEIYALTPKGDVVSLPIGSTPIDFAFKIHTEIGCTCVGAKVNNKMVRLSTPLNNGDLVQILTKNKSMPKRDWLNYIVTPHAKSQVRKYTKSS